MRYRIWPVELPAKEALFPTRMRVHGVYNGGQLGWSLGWPVLLIEDRILTFIRWVHLRHGVFIYNFFRFLQEILNSSNYKMGFVHGERALNFF